MKYEIIWKSILQKQSNSTKHGNSKRIKSILQKLYKNVLQNNSTNSHKFTPQNTYIEEAKKIKKNYSPNNKIKKENNKKREKYVLENYKNIEIPEEKLKIN